MTTAFDPAQIERPHQRLFQYYLLCSLLTGPAFPFAIIPLWLRYVTLRYKFDADGVSMSYGVFFRREVNLTYRRLQDIHLTRNLLQRWMGLATISLQTASGNAQAEMTIEGVLEAEPLRDFLYARMRGARDEHPTSMPFDAASKLESVAAVHDGHPRSPTSEQTLQTLTEIRDALAILVARQGAKS